jgi:hypothetical protein
MRGAWCASPSGKASKISPQCGTTRPQDYKTTGLQDNRHHGPRSCCPVVPSSSGPVVLLSRGLVVSRCVFASLRLCVNSVCRLPIGCICFALAGVFISGCKSCRCSLKLAAARAVRQAGRCGFGRLRKLSGPEARNQACLTRSADIPVRSGFGTAARLGLVGRFVRNMPLRTGMSALR